MKSRKKYIKKSKRILAFFIAASLILTSLFSYYMVVNSNKKTEETSNAKDSDEIRSFLNSSNEAANQGNYDKALEDIQKAIEINASISDIYMQRANIYINISQYQKAIDDFTKALDLNKNLTQIYALRGHLYYQTEAYNQALSDYNNALKYTPDDADILIMRVNIYLMDQKYQQALDDINRLVKIQPNNGTYHKIGGDACVSMENYNEAIMFYTNAIENLTDTSVGEVFYNRGLCFIQIANYENGESDFTNAIGLDYSTDQSYFQRGLCRYSQQNYNGTIEDLKKYETVFPDSTEYLIYLGISYFTTDQPALAKTYFQKCINNNIMPGESNYYLAGIALDVEDYKASIDYYTKAIELETQIIPSTFNRTIAYLHIDDTQSAKKDFQAVIDDGSNKELSDAATNALSQMND